MRCGIIRLVSGRRIDIDDIQERAHRDRTH